MRFCRSMFLIAVVIVLVLGIFLVAASVSPRPPESALSSSDETQTGTLGAFCWLEKRWWGTAGTCTSSTASKPPDVPEDKLVVSSGSTMVFNYGGDTALAEIQAVAYVLGKNESSIQETRKEQSQIPLHAVQLGKRTEMTAELPPGEYNIQVNVTVSEESSSVLIGEASYGFHVEVLQHRHASR